MPFTPKERETPTSACPPTPSPRTPGTSPARTSSGTSRSTSWGTVPDDAQGVITEFAEQSTPAAKICRTTHDMDDVADSAHLQPHIQQTHGGVASDGAGRCARRARHVKASNACGPGIASEGRAWFTLRGESSLVRAAGT